LLLDVEHDAITMAVAAAATIARKTVARITSPLRTLTLSWLGQLS
jgi:hypothetical protein